VTRGSLKRFSQAQQPERLSLNEKKHALRMTANVSAEKPNLIFPE
jgi:hypothetical protein